MLRTVRPHPERTCARLEGRPSRAMVRDGARAPPHHEDPDARTHCPLQFVRFLILRSPLLRASRRMKPPNRTCASAIRS